MCCVVALISIYHINCKLCNIVFIIPYSLSSNKHFRYGYLVVGDVAGIVARLVDKKSGLADREKRHVTFFKPTGEYNNLGL